MCGVPGLSQHTQVVPGPLQLPWLNNSCCGFLSAVITLSACTEDNGLCLLVLLLLQKELEQPISYLKEVLNEVASQVKLGPNKDLWALKKHLITGSAAPQ
jgi:hypothetical protein